MTLKAFLFLFVVTIVAVVASATIAEKFVDPGFERGIVIAVLSSLVVFPAARWAEYRGWIKGDWSPGGQLRKAQDERRAREAREVAEAAGAAVPGADAEGSSHPHSPPADDRPGDAPAAGNQPSPGDPR
ncbi:MAG: hypothetical protein GX652_14205 [Burkholderiaceae bacterium]|nr:hypothetical protein [Burkholderiaceae bacterium]